MESMADPRLKRAGVSGFNKPKRTPSHLKNLFLSRYERGKRLVVNINELLAEQQRQFI